MLYQTQAELWPDDQKLQNHETNLSILCCNSTSKRSNLPMPYDLFLNTKKKNRQCDCFHSSMDSICCMSLESLFIVQEQVKKRQIDPPQVPIIFLSLFQGPRAIGVGVQSKKQDRVVCMRLVSSSLERRRTIYPFSNSTNHSREQNMQTPTPKHLQMLKQCL